MREHFCKAAILLIVIIFLVVFFNIRGQLQEKQAMINRVEFEMLNYALQPQALYDALESTLHNPTKENFKHLAPLWQSTQYNIQSLIRMNKSEIKEKVYNNYYQYQHNQVYAMFITYADPELKSFEMKRKDDLKRILTAWGDFSQYIKVFGGYHEIENPNQFTQEYTKFLKEARIEWP